MECGATVWDPYQKYNSDKVERVQHRAAMFVKIINSLPQVPFEGVLVEAYKGTIRKTT